MVVSIEGEIRIRGGMSMNLLRNPVFCVFKHRWVYDLRFYHVHRKCNVCGEVQRHHWSREADYSDWECIRERVYVESQQKGIARTPAAPLVRLAHSLRILRSRARDRRRSWARFAGS